VARLFRIGLSDDIRQTSFGYNRCSEFRLRGESKNGFRQARYVWTARRVDASARVVSRRSFDPLGPRSGRAPVDIVGSNRRSGTYRRAVAHDVLQAGPLSLLYKAQLDRPCERDAVYLWPSDDVEGSTERSSRNRTATRRTFWCLSSHRNRRSRGRVRCRRAGWACVDTARASSTNLLSFPTVYGPFGRH
jgi:hypothetical protein